MTFIAKTVKISSIANLYPDKIGELESICADKTNIYIDRANVYKRQEKLGRHIDIKRLYQFLRSFSSIDHIRLYHGTLQGDQQSENFVHEAKLIGYHLTTKAVKIMKHSIDISSLHTNTSSDAIIKNFISKGLLRQLNTTCINYLNQELEKLNHQGIRFIEERKCNFDVEIGVDMILDYERSSSSDYYKSYVLWSGDSDFTDIVQKLLQQGKKVYIFSTTQRVSKELSESGAIIYDIQKIRDFICRTREMTTQAQGSLLL